MKNQLKNKIQNKEKVFGTFFTIGNTGVMECLGYTGLDFVIIDTEHGPFDTETAMNLIRMAESVHLTPMMRIADVSHKEIQRAVDIGAKGLVVPCLRTIEEIKKLVSLAKFPPVGNRGFIKGRNCGFGYQEWAKDINQFMKVSNEQILILPQCETVECLDIIEEVMKIDGVDGIFIGPFDLSIAMGIPAQFDHPDFTNAIKRILAASHQNNKPAFIFTGTFSDATKYIKSGFDGLAHTVDTIVFIEAYKEIVDGLHKCLKS